MDLGNVGAGIAAVNGAIAIGLTLASLLGAKRLNATQEWLERAIALENQDPVKEVLRDEARRITARLVARQQVPPTMFVELVIWTLFVAVLAATASWLAIVAAFLTLWLTARRTVRLVKERIRIVGEVHTGRLTGRARVGILHQFEGGTRDEFIWAGLYALGVSMLSFAVGDAIDAGSLRGADTPIVFMGLTGAALLAGVMEYWRLRFQAALAAPVPPRESGTTNTS